MRKRDGAARQVAAPARCGYNARMIPPRWLPVLLGFLTATGPLSTDMYLPAFPAIEASLGVPAGSAQITLSAWFVGLAIGQLLQGMLADRFGRRAPLIAGTAVYAVANFGCVFAPDLTAFSALRLVLAVGGSASMVIPRAIVRDLADGHAAARLMSRLMLVMGAAPILAPTLGGAVLAVTTWHGIFWINTAYGAICAVLVWRLLPDTLPVSRRVRLRPAGLAQRFAAIGRDRVFMAYVLTGGCAMFGMFAYIGGSPPVIIGQFGASPVLYGVLFSCSAAAFIVGSQINPFLLLRWGAERVMRGAVAAYVVATSLMLACAVAGFGGVAGLVLPAVLAMGSMGFLMPNTAVGALSRHAAQAGSASALMGTLQFCMAAVSGALVGLLGDGTARPLAALMVAGALGALYADRRRPSPTRMDGPA